MYKIVPLENFICIDGPWSCKAFLTASKYCGSGLKIDLVVVVDVDVVILVLVIKLLSKSTTFICLKGNWHILFNGKMNCLD